MSSLKKFRKQRIKEQTKLKGMDSMIDKALADGSLKQLLDDNKVRVVDAEIVSEVNPHEG